MFCKLHWEQNNSQSLGMDHEDHWAHQSSPCYVISHKLIHSSYQLQERCIITLLQGRKVHRLPKVTALTNGRAGTESKPCGFSAQSAHINHGFKLGFAEDRGRSVALSALSSQSYGFSSGYVWMWELDYEESWVLKNLYFWTLVLEKTLESSLDCKEIQPVHPKGNQSWIFIGRTDAEAETPII